MRRFFHFRTIKAKIIWYNFFILCVIAVIFSVSSYVTANKKAVQVATNSLAYHVESIASRYEIAYEEMVNILLNCTEGGAFDLGLLGDMETPAQRKKGLDYARIASDFCAVAGYGSYIKNLSLFNDSCTLVQTGTAYGSRDDGKRIMESAWFEREAQKAMDHYELDLIEPVFYQETEPMLPMVRRISGGGRDSYAALFLSVRMFEDELKRNDSGNEMLVATHTGERAASLRELPENRRENDALIAMLAARKEDTGVLERKVHGRDSIVAYSRYPRSGILVAEILDKGTLKNDRVMLIQTIGGIFAGCMAIGMVLSFIFTSQVKRPIDRLLGRMERISRGEFEPDPSVESGDEIGALGAMANNMASQIGRLMDQRLKDEKEKSSLELKMLQAQINPHFLYNTLDSIKWIAVIQKNNGIVKVVTALSGLLRNMAKGFNEKVSVRKELEFVEDYVTIEKIKYAQMFDVEIRVEEEDLYQASIVKLTLQPLVENAIFSGIEPSGKNGLILIRVYREGDCLCASVRDNGVGIEKERIARLLSGGERLTGDRMSSIGMANVDRRIKLTYGFQYGLSIESQPGAFTEVTARLPLEWQEGMGEDKKTGRGL